jgi:hypothetical protein
MKSEDLEDTSILQFKRLCTNHIRHMTPELDNRMAVYNGQENASQYWHGFGV